MRIAEKGGDPSKVNPVVQTQLIVDHSLAVECGGYDPDAFRKNREIEDRRNEAVSISLTGQKPPLKTWTLSQQATALCKSTWKKCRL